MAMGFARIACWLALWALAFGAGPAAGQVRKAGLTGAAFLKIGVGARPVALGSAYTTVPADVNQMFWNPAGIALSKGRTQISFTYNRWIADLNHYAAAVSHDFGRFGTWGVGLVALGLDGITADREIVPEFAQGSFVPYDTRTAPTYDYNDTAANVTWAFNVTDKLAVGATARYISESIDTEDASAIAFDLGAIYRIGYRGARVGARINNLGSDIEFYDIAAPLPLVFSIGASVDVVDDADRGLRLTAMLDAVKPQDAEQLVYLAGEMQVATHFVLRGGYKLNYTGVTDDKRDELYRDLVFAAPRTEEGFTLGAGVHLPLSRNRLQVDYAFTEFGILDNVHRLSVQLEL
jgi:hypothetical protein